MDSKQKLPLAVALSAIAWGQLFTILSAVKIDVVREFANHPMEATASRIILGPVSFWFTLLAAILLMFPAMVWRTAWKEGRDQIKEERASLEIGYVGTAFLLLGFGSFLIYLGWIFAGPALVALVTGTIRMIKAEKSDG
jgi:hypothetical protein